MLNKLWKDRGIRFIGRFIGLFLLFYCFNLFYIGLTAEGGSFYWEFAERNLNYIRGLRDFLIASASKILEILGYDTYISAYRLKIIGGVSVGVGYSCLGFGLMSSFAAFIIAYPRTFSEKTAMLIFGFSVINLLNVLRIAAVGMVYSYYSNKQVYLNIDHHLIFNCIVYAVLIAIVYKWLK